MLRRLCAFLLALVCVLTPALPAHASTKGAAADCCCGNKCACDNECAAPAPNAPSRAPNLPATVIEQRVVAARPDTRAAFATYVRGIELILISDSSRSIRPEAAIARATAV